MCILIVEDEPVILEIMADALEEAGYDVLCAADGAEAMALISAGAHPFSAIVSDYHLPGGLNGLDLIAAFRSRHPGQPLILATARPDVLNDAGATDIRVLAKPYAPSTLLVLVGGLLPPHHQP